MSPTEFIVTAVVFLLIGICTGINQEWSQHRKVCPCSECKEWRECTRVAAVHEPHGKEKG
jgi:hypothetical protein